MFFAAWWPAARAAPPLIEERVRPLSLTAAARAEGPTSIVAAWAPARIEERASEHRVLTSPFHDGVPPGHPSVSVDDDRLTVAAAFLPQYPVYYAHTDEAGCLLVSSRLAPLASLLPQAPIAAPRLVSLCAGPLDTDDAGTVFVGVRRLRAAERLFAGPGGVRVERRIPELGSRYRRAPPEDLAAELRHHLEQAVVRAAGSARRVTVFVSGGLDSSGVLAVAAREPRAEATRQVQALSVCTARPGRDRPHLMAVSRSVGLEPQCLPAIDAGRWLRRSLCLDAQPIFLSSTCVDLLLCSEAAARGAEAVLTGVSGDRINGGPLAFAQALRRGHPFAAVAGALRVRLPWRSSRMTRLREFVISPLLPRAWKRLRIRRAPLPAWLTPRARRLVRRGYEAKVASAGPLPDTPDAWMKELCTRDLLPEVADLGGAVASATNVMPCDVFLDFDFVRFMLQLDPLLLSHGHEFRGLYRLALQGLLPEGVRRRQDKEDISLAVTEALRASDALDLLRDLSSLRSLESCGLVSARASRSLFEDWLAQMTSPSAASSEHWQRVWQLLSVEAFLREHGRGRQVQ